MEWTGMLQYDSTRVVYSSTAVWEHVQTVAQHMNRGAAGGNPCTWKYWGKKSGEGTSSPKGERKPKQQANKMKMKRWENMKRKQEAQAEEQDNGKEMQKETR